MGARTFELADVTDEAGLLATGFIAVDSENYPVAKRKAYSELRKPIRPAESLKGAPYTLVTGDAGNTLVFTVATTLTVPIAAALGTGFRVTVYADGVAVAVSRSGGGSFNLAAGETAVILTLNNKVAYYKQATAVL